MPTDVSKDTKTANFTSNRNWIKAYIVDVLPCISIAFYVLAFIFHSFFYSVFGIDIIQYTTFGDIFISITAPLIEYALMTAIIMAFMVDLYNNKIYGLVEKQKKRRSEKIKYHKIYYSYMRFLVKRKQGIRKIFGLSSKKKNTNIIFSIGLSLIFFVACIGIYEKLIEDKVLKPSLSTLSVALYLPLVIIFLFCLFLVRLNPKKELIKFQNLKKRPIRVAIFVVCYYIYAVISFSGTGSACAMQLIENNTVVFETLTSDGSVFTNKDYGYIGHMSNETFLYNKKTKDCVILSNEGIVYTKINTNNRRGHHDAVTSHHFEETIFDVWEKIKNSI